MTGFALVAALFLAVGICHGGDVLGYRNFVASDAVQDDLLGTVRSVSSQTFEETEKGERKLIKESATHYDPKGYLVEDRDFDVEEKQSSFRKRTYDDSGNLIAEEESEDGRVVRKKVRLAPERRRVYWEAESGDGKSVLLEEMTFDRFGKEGEGRDYDAKGNVSSQYKARRNEAGKEVEVTFSDAMGRPESIIRVTWDKRGFPVASEYEEVKKKLFVKEQSGFPEIDSQGNWLKQTKTEEFFEGNRKIGTTKTTVVRTIDYY